MSNRRRTAAQARADQRKRLWLYGGIAAVVVAAIAIAVVLGGGGSSSSSSSEAKPVTVGGTPLSTFGGEGTDEAVGQAIPSVSGTDLLTGKPVAIADNGKAKVLMFVAHWCPHCRKEVPLIGPDVAANGLPAGVEMIAVSTGVKPDAPNYPPSAWLQENNWPTPVLADDEQGSVAEAFGLANYPYFVFVGADGKVVSRTSGEIPLSEFRDRVNELVS